MFKLKAYAKLNLNLHLLPNILPNGYYEVNFINCELALYDELTFEKTKKSIEVVCSHPEVPNNRDNLVFKSAYLLKQYSGNSQLGARIIINKKIPVKAGLGGGSSDAAVTLKGLSDLWNIELSQDKLLKLASLLGKDVCYSVIGGVCEIGGDGSIVKRLFREVPELYLVIVIPDKSKPSTKLMYQSINPDKIGKNTYHLSKLKKAIEKKDRLNIILNLYNEFEEQVINKYPVITKIKNDLRNTQAIKTLLLGSGLAYAGFYLSKNTAVKAQVQLSKKYKNIIQTQTFTKSVRVGNVIRYY